jgi:hypothetical protein
LATEYLDKHLGEVQVSNEMLYELLEAKEAEGRWGEEMMACLERTKRGTPNVLRGLLKILETESVFSTSRG